MAGWGRKVWCLRACRHPTRGERTATKLPLKMLPVPFPRLPQPHLTGDADQVQQAKAQGIHGETGSTDKVKHRMCHGHFTREGLRNGDYCCKEARHKCQITLSLATPWRGLVAPGSPAVETGINRCSSENPRPSASGDTRQRR